MSKKRQEKKQSQKDKLSTLILIALGCFTLILLILLSLNFGVFNALGNALTPQKPTIIYGQCYSMLNTILYQINSEEDCKKQCTDNCWVLKKDYQDSKFVPTNNSCNLCNCYCKQK